ncbi:unnamed protein product [Trichobilharzia szidati]|nr:unnamed protein product [Trichobilharzia szidati]
MILLHILSLLLIEASIVHLLPTENNQLTLDEITEYINNHPSAGWKAEKYSRFQSIEDARHALGSLLLKDSAEINKKVPVISHKHLEVKLPKKFDARKKWKNCSSIGTVYDSSRCNSVYAMVAAATMSDRICIQSYGKKNITLSSIDIVSCCTDCGDGCQGGYYLKPWDFWLTKGIVTGGTNKSSNSCLPYPFPKCEHAHTKGKYPECKSGTPKTPKCTKTCQPSYKVKYDNDKQYGNIYYMIYQNEIDIMKEIFVKGPVEAAFNVYLDFLSYKSGIYKHITGQYLGDAPIRIIGWGEENHTRYWLCSHVWNEDWGEKGYFRILRGKNECAIESSIVGGEARK